MRQLFLIARRSGALCDPRAGLRRLLIALSLCVILVPAPDYAVAQGHPHKEHKRDEKREIETVEEQWRMAQLTGDVATMQKLLADDYFGISISGQLNDKGQQLERLRNRKLMLSRIDLADMRVKLLGRVAIVTSLAKIEGTDAGDAIQGTYRYTRVYKRYPDGSWKITNFEVTRVPKTQ